MILGETGECRDVRNALLVAGAIAGGCTRDAPLVAPDLESTVVTVAPPSALAAKSKDGPVADAISDALQQDVAGARRLRDPAAGSAARVPDAAERDPSAWDALRRALEATAPKVPEENRPDLDALRFELDAVAPR